MNGQTVEITQEFLYYVSHNGTKKRGSSGEDTDPSGAYIFRPGGAARPFGAPKIVSQTRGRVVDEVHQQINQWITQIIRVYKGTHNYVEFDWLVGPLDVSRDSGVEVITRFTVENFSNNKTFYTDSNGRELIRRILDYRPTYSYDPSYEPIASNYYPVTSRILIRDEQRDLEVAVLNDRSQGGASVAEGQIELMVHRRTLHDDYKGVDEPLNETEFGQGIVARGQHYLILGLLSKALEEGITVAAQERFVAQQKLFQPWVGLGDAANVPKNSTEQLLNLNYSALQGKLPENVNILTLEPWTDSKFLLRLEHFMEKNEDPHLSLGATVDLENLLSDYRISQAVETTLAANRILSSTSSRYDWSYKGSLQGGGEMSLNLNKINLNPMDIRTFIVELQAN